jgi:hypothetical protein
MHISAMSCACKSVGKPGKGLVSIETGFKLLDLDAGRAQSLKHLLQKVWASPVQEYIAGGDRGRHGIGPGLDAVGKDSMLDAVESLSPLDP